MNAAMLARYGHQQVFPEGIAEAPADEVRSLAAALAGLAAKDNDE